MAGAPGEGVAIASLLCVYAIQMYSFFIALKLIIQLIRLIKGECTHVGRFVTS